MLLNIPPHTGQPSLTKNYLTQNINRAEAEPFGAVCKTEP